MMISTIVKSVLRIYLTSYYGGVTRKYFEKDKVQQRTKQTWESLKSSLDVPGLKMIEPVYGLFSNPVENRT